MMMIGLLLLVSLSIAQIEAQVGPFPAVGPHQRQPRVASSKKFTPTNVWWSNWNLNQGANQIQTYPYIVIELILYLKYGLLDQIFAKKNY